MHHLTLSELAQRRQSSEQEVFEQCQELGVPIVHGRVDRTLFEKALAAAKASSAEPAPSAASA